MIIHNGLLALLVYRPVLLASCDPNDNDSRATEVQVHELEMVAKAAQAKVDSDTKKREVMRRCHELHLEGAMALAAKMYQEATRGDSGSRGVYEETRKLEKRCAKRMREQGMGTFMMPPPAMPNPPGMQIPPVMPTGQDPMLVALQAQVQALQGQQQIKPHRAISCQKLGVMTGPDGVKRVSPKQLFLEGKATAKYKKVN